MTTDLFIAQCELLLQQFRNVAPYRTGNLALNAIKMEMPDANTCIIYVDETIAPYMKYTNESWNNFQPPLLKKQNPNEHWWDNFCNRVAKTMASYNIGATINGKP